MSDDFISDTAGLFGDALHDDGKIKYGPLVLTTAPKEGKANTLLADHLFSPSLLLAELIERGLIPLKGKRGVRSVIELGAGCALPSLLSTTLMDSPSIVVITDYPDDTIMTNLKANTERNYHCCTNTCTVFTVGYEWGEDVRPIKDILNKPKMPGGEGFDVVIMSDLLHFDQSHDVLVQSLITLLWKDPSSRVYVAAGKYTKPHVCDHFVDEVRRMGILLEEGEVDPIWHGELDVSGGGLDREQLGVRKEMCRWWTGRWYDYGFVTN